MSVNRALHTRDVSRAADSARPTPDIKNPGQTERKRPDAGFVKF